MGLFSDIDMRLLPQQRGRKKWSLSLSHCPPTARRETFLIMKEKNSSMYWRGRQIFSMAIKNIHWKKEIAFTSIPAFLIGGKELGKNPPRP
jgi:hypothetical protein